MVSRHPLQEYSKAKHLDPALAIFLPIILDEKILELVLVSYQISN